MSRVVRIAVKSVAAALVVAVAIAIGLVVAVNVSPRPFAWYIQQRFADGVGVAPVTPTLYTDLAPRVRTDLDIEYPSRHGTNRLDVFAPVDAPGPLPTIIWTHGGGFVGGDKSGIVTWATLAAARGYAVVSINYARAPDARYPVPIEQIGEVYSFLRGNPDRFPSVDVRRLIFGGDSAGAQMAAQFVALQTSPSLAVAMQMAPVVPPGDIVATVLYCGPYDLVGLYDRADGFLGFFVRQIGWAYFGRRSWRDLPEAAAASVVRHATPGFPPTFLTDGNTGSFERDARSLEERLRGQGVHVESLFYGPEHGAIGHEYQFDFALAESLECYERTMAFLDRVVATPRGSGR